VSKKKYILAGKEYTLKEKYSLKDWGKILKELSEAKAEDENSFDTVVNLMAGGGLERTLNLILDRPLEGELMETDVEEVGKVITDFFSRKSALTNITKRSSIN